MGRRAEGLKIEWRNGIGIARFTWKKHRHFISTGETDPERAKEIGEQIYAEVIGGKRRKVSAALTVLQPLDVLFAEWLASLEGVLDVETIKTYQRTYVPTHFLPFFKTFDRVCDEAVIDEYGRERLRCVLRRTMQHELGALRQFLLWCKMRGLISAMPAWPEYPRSAKGGRVGPQRRKANELSEDQIRTAVNRLPLFSDRISKIDRKRFAIRPRFIVGYETGLRPATLDAISIPEHWAPGRTVLSITEDIDKARFERDLTLTPIALEALELTVRELHIESGPIFGRHDYRPQLRKVGLDDELRSPLAPYDFRHARGTHMADRGVAGTGIAFQLDHTQLTTTNKYVHATRRAGEAALKKGSALDSGAIPDQEDP